MRTYFSLFKYKLLEASPWLSLQSTVPTQQTTEEKKAYSSFWLPCMELLLCCRLHSDKAFSTQLDCKPDQTQLLSLHKFLLWGKIERRWSLKTIFAHKDAGWRPIPLQFIVWVIWTVKKGNGNPVFWTGFMNRGKKSTTGRSPQTLPKLVWAGAMIYRHPYRLLSLSSCQLGRPNGWLKCMCGHPGVKWKLWLRQQIDPCGRAYGCVPRNVTDILGFTSSQSFTTVLPHKLGAYGFQSFPFRYRNVYFSVHSKIKELSILEGWHNA